MTNAPTGGPVAPECVKAVERTAGLLAELGHDVFEGEPMWPDPMEFVPLFMVVWNTNIAYWDSADWSKVEPLSAAMRERAQAVSSLDYVRALMMLQIHSRRIVQCWGRDFDVLLTPTLAMEPPKVGEMFEGGEKDPMLPLVENAVRMAPFTPLINMTGQPAVSLPLHSTPAGLPIGVQLVGKPWGEAELIRLSAQLEQAAPWKDRHPRL
jgi:amidase